MALVLNEDEQMMRESAAGFFADKAPVEKLRKLRDSRTRPVTTRLCGGKWHKWVLRGY